MSAGARMTRGGPSGRPIVPLLLVAAAVALPTICILWFMGEAMSNERDAVRQRLTSFYRAQAQTAARNVTADWNTRLSSLSRIADTTTGTPGIAFAALTNSGQCDSALILDAQGQCVYPGKASSAAVDTSASETAVALQAQARTLVSTGDTTKGLTILREITGNTAFADARDASGRLLQLNAMLLAADLAAQDRTADTQKLAQQFSARASDYRGVAMPPAQRRFLLAESQRVDPTTTSAALLAAEELAADLVARRGDWNGIASSIAASPVAGIWQAALPHAHAIAFFHEDNVRDAVSRTLAQSIPAGQGVKAAIIPPGSAPLSPTAIADVPLPSPLEGWRVILALEGEDVFAKAARSRIALHVWVAILGVLVAALAAIAAARAIIRQTRVAQLKNDLMATVSHEMKTPLASMRLLLDTLIDSRASDHQQTLDYLDLMNRETSRLSRVIGNFLTFSRMERNRSVFEFSEVQPREVVEMAVTDAGERFRQPGCTLEVYVAEGLPTITADREALCTAVLNLLDNAWKFTGEEKRITLRTHRDGGWVKFEVEDNGIGIASRAQKRVFERFYQADRSLSRRAGGCGLGLSIVRFIATAHRGDVNVTSTPGQGSTFTLRIPTDSRQ